MVSEITDLDLTPPITAQKNAKKVLEWREDDTKTVRGLTTTGWIRTKQIAEGEELPIDVVKSLSEFQSFRENSYVSEEYKGLPWRDPGHVAWKGRGGDVGINWAVRMSNRIQSIENNGFDTVSMIEHNYNGDETTIENNMYSRIASSFQEDNEIDAQHFKDYFNKYGFLDGDFERAVTRMIELKGMMQTLMTDMVNHDLNMYEDAESRVPLYSDRVSVDDWENYIDKLSYHPVGKYKDMAEKIEYMHSNLSNLMYQMVSYDYEVRTGSDQGIEEVLSQSESLQYSSIEECVDYHIEEGFSEEDAHERCLDIMGLERTLTDAIIPTHEGLGEYGTMDSSDWSGVTFSEFKDSYDLEENSFTALSDKKKRMIAAHFGIVNAGSYDEARYNDLQLPHHNPETGDVDRAGVIAARQRVKQSEAPQKKKEALDTHLVKHLRNDFDEENVSKILSECYDTKGIVIDHSSESEYENVSLSEEDSFSMTDFVGGETEFRELSQVKKIYVASHFARVDNNSLEDAKFTDMQLMHHDPDTGDVSEDLIKDCMVRINNSDLPEEDVNAVKSHLNQHLEKDLDKDISIHEGALVSFEGKLGERYGYVVDYKEEEELCDVKIYEPQGSEWESAEKIMRVEENELSDEDEFPQTMQDAFESNKHRSDKEEELSDQKITMDVSPMDYHQLKKKDKK